ncbi:MAG: type II secretion system F family protein [Acidimicrobiales bacterium]
MAAGTSLRRTPRQRAQDWMAQAGLGEVALGEFAAVIGALALLGLVAGVVVFGGLLPALVLAGFAGSAPVASYRRRRARRRDQARDAWPRLIDEIRILTGRAGRSVPQAVFEVGRSAPPELRPAFAAAHREWMLSTDFARTLDVLKRRLADPTADATCETLLIAHELGGTDLDGRLEALADDRRQDSQGRKDALAKQAGVRFARRFVLIVPLGMALVGLSIGNGRSAYQTPFGQVIVVVALGLVVLCWLWAGRIMRLPDEQRVFP